MAASNSGGSGPIILTDTLTTQVGVLIQKQSSLNQYCINQMAAVDQDSATLMIYGQNKSGGYYTYQPLVNTGAGPSLTIASPLSVEGSGATGSTIDIDYNGSQGAVTLDNSTSDNTASINWIASDNSAVNSSITHSAGTTITASRVNAVNSSTKTVAINFLTGGTSSLMLFDNSGSAFNSSATGPSDISTQMSIVSLTSTLGAIIYNNSSNLIKVATYNISGSTITVDAATSSSITATSGAKSVRIDSTHILFVYKKTTNTLGARIVTVATGSTFTFGTEYTATATGITDDPIGNPGQMGSSDYGVTWINGNGQGCCTLMSISGSTITLSNPIIYHTANNVIATTDYYSSYFMGLSSNTAGALAYLINSNSISGQTALTRAVVVDKNFTLTSHLWTTTFAGNLQAANTGNTGSGCTDAISIGTNKMLSVNVNNSTSVNFYTYDVDYKSMNISPTNYTFTTSSACKTVSLSPLGYSSGSTTSYRALMAYNDGTSTIKAVVASVSSAGAVTFGTGSNVDTNASSPAAYSVLALNYGTDTTLVVNVEASNMFASIVTTSGTTISSVSTPTNIFTQSSPTPFDIQGIVLDNAGTILLTFDFDTGTNHAMIISITGSTITTGTPVTLTSSGGGGAINGACLLAAGRGVFTYQTSTGQIKGRPYSYSGTTITLGTEVSIDTNTGGSTGNGTKMNLITLNSNEALLTYVNQGQVLTNVVITSTSGTTFSVGTKFTNSHISTSNNSFFTGLDSYSQAVGLSLDGSNNIYITMSYRV